MSLLAPSALIVNPAATRSRARLLQRVTDVLVPFGLDQILVTRGPGDARRIARAAVDAGATLLVTLGGDGTVAQVASVASDADVVIAPLPAGGANVFSRALGWPAAPADAAKALAPALAVGTVRRVTVGSVATADERRTFIVNAGVGLDAETVEWVEARPDVKARLRQAAFGIGLSVAVSRAVRAAPHLELRVPGQPPIEAAAVVTATCSPYTYLGALPVHLLPPADFDGQLAWMALPQVTAAGLAAVAAGSLRGHQRHLEGGRTVAGRAPTIRISANEPVPVQADGEPLGAHATIEMTAGPSLSVLVPPVNATAALKSPVNSPTSARRTKDGPR